MRSLAVENGINQAEDIEAGTVGDGSLYGFHGDLATFGQQLEFFDFLRGCQQVAFHARGNQVDGITLG
ncbi:hypothetical protein D3C81_1833400 [compost metagenome]